MSDIRPMCFFIMPLTPESHFFYLYLKDHVENNLRIRCERADQSVGPKSFMDKILRYIHNSDVIIVDCNNSYPNVYYELGIATNLDKKIIYITKEEIDDIPSDMKHFDFISYKSLKPKEFIEKLDLAFKQIFEEQYDTLYDKALEFHSQFKRDQKIRTQALSKEEFIQNIESAKESEKIPQIQDEIALKRFLIPKITANSTDLTVMEKITEWLL